MKNDIEAYEISYKDKPALKHVINIITHPDTVETVVTEIEAEKTVVFNIIGPQGQLRIISLTDVPRGAKGLKTMLIKAGG